MLMLIKWKAGVAVLMSDKLDLRAKIITKDKESDNDKGSINPP